MRQHGQAIAAKLNDNVLTYRDDRLTGVERQQQVTPFARRLQENPLPYQLLAGLCAAAAVALIVVAFISPQSSNPAFIIIFAGFCIGNITKARNIKQTNRWGEASYYYLYMTDRGKPLQSSPPGNIQHKRYT